MAGLYCSFNTVVELYWWLRLVAARGKVANYNVELEAHLLHTVRRQDQIDVHRCASCGRGLHISNMYVLCCVAVLLYHRVVGSWRCR